MLLDTSGLLCLHHRDDPQHETAIQHLADAVRGFTHNYVLAEFIALAVARRLPRPRTLAFLAELEQNPLVEIVHVDPALHRSAMILLRQRQDKNWSLCDAVSFLLMNAKNIREALTTDHHFEQAGFVRLLQP
jgi:uncharacterized protein